MYEIVKLLFDICLFKKGPQDLPYSRRLQKKLISAYAVTRFLIIDSEAPWFTKLFQITIEIVFIASFSWVMLYLDRRLNRYRQVSSAFFGTFALIGFFAVPAAASMKIYRAPVLVFFVMIALTGWFCAVTTHIIHHALEQRLNLSVGVALLFLLASYLLLDVLSL
ncbi:MAG: hypothetical protein ACU84H_10425 [Gammaproteobacteria bacterium]